MVGLLPLRAEGAVVRRRGRRLLGPVDFEIGGRGVTIVLGPNGAGKTTLLRMLHGMERLAEGRLVTALGRDAARRRQAFVFQAPVMMRRTVLANMAFPLRLRGAGRAEARARAMDWVRRVGLGAMPGRPAHLLSGGERQKLALGRALIAGPELLFLDEPCANLDGPATQAIETLLRSACEGGTRIVMATHDFGQARRLADEIVVVHRGRLVETGPAAAMLAAPRTPEAAAFLRGDILT